MIDSEISLPKLWLKTSSQSCYNNKKRAEGEKDG